MMKIKTIPPEQRNRVVFFSLISQHLNKLYDLVRKELASSKAEGDLMSGELTAEDIVDEVLLTAYRQFAKGPRERRIGDWLMKLAKERLAAETGRLRSEHRRTVHTEEDIPETPPKEEVSTLGDEILDFYEPDEDLKLEDIIPDISVPSPEEEAEREELRLCVSFAFSGMPRQWRQALLLRHEEGLDTAELAKAMGKPVPEIQRILEHARFYLQEKLEEAGCDFKPPI